MALQAETARHFLNLTLSKGSEAEPLQVRDNGLACYSSSNQLLMHHVVHDIGRVFQSQWRRVLYMWIRFLLALCDLDNWKLCFLWLLASGSPFLLSGRNVEGQVGHKDFGHVKCKSPCFFENRLWLWQCVLVSLSRFTPSCFLPGRCQRGRSSEAGYGGNDYSSRLSLYWAWKGKGWWRWVTGKYHLAFTSSGYRKTFYSKTESL